MKPNDQLKVVTRQLMTITPMSEAEVEADMSVTAAASDASSHQDSENIFALIAICVPTLANSAILLSRQKAI